MVTEVYQALLDSCDEDEYIVPGHHDPDMVRLITELGLFGKEREEAYLKCYIKPRKVRRG